MDHILAYLGKFFPRKFSHQHCERKDLHDDQARHRSVRDSGVVNQTKIDAHFRLLPLWICRLCCLSKFTEKLKTLQNSQEEKESSEVGGTLILG